MSAPHYSVYIGHWGSFHPIRCARRKQQIKELLDGRVKGELGSRPGTSRSGNRGGSRSSRPNSRHRLSHAAPPPGCVLSFGALAPHLPVFDLNIVRCNGELCPLIAASGAKLNWTCILEQYSYVYLSLIRDQNRNELNFLFSIKNIQINAVFHFRKRYYEECVKSCSRLENVD